VHVWDLRTGEHVREMAAYSGVALFTPDGRYLVAKPYYEPCKIWETASWAQVRTLDSERAGVAISHDSALLALGRSPVSVTLFDLQGGSPLATLEWPSSLPTRGWLAFSPDGDRLAIALPRRIQVWELGRIREKLVELNLDWDLPAYPVADDGDASPLRAEIQLGLLARPDPERPPCVHGRIIVMDPQGVAYAQASGSFTLRLWRQTGPGSYASFGPDQTVVVVEGLWQSRAPEGLKLEVRDLRLGGRVAFVGNEKISIPESREMTLRARWPKPSTVRVFDPTGATELEDIDVVRYSDWDHEHDIHPAGDREAKTVLGGAASPIRLPAEDRSCVYWIRAPGYAWRSVSVNHLCGGEQEVRLEPGGALEVTLSNHKPVADSHLYIYRAPRVSGVPALQIMPDRTGLVVVEHLAAGKYGLMFVVGEWSRSPVPLGFGVAEVTADHRTEVRLNLLDPSVKEPTVALAGTLEVPVAWGEVRPRIVLSDVEFDFDMLVRRATLTKLEPGIYRWDAGAVPPGPYVVDVHRFGLQVLIAVGAGGNQEARIRVPEPVDLVVRVLDRATNEPADLGVLLWNVAHLPGLIEGPVEPVKRDPKSRNFPVRIPAGEIEFHVHGDLVGSHTERREIRPGLREITLYVDCHCGIEVVLKDGDVTVPFRGELRIRAERPEGGEVKQTGYSRTASGHMLLLKEPGCYRIAFAGSLEGYLPIPPQTVMVERGKRIKLEVQLERRK
jgi:hypothetical protein